MLTITLYPMLRMLGVQLHAALSGSYVAGHHSILLINCPTEQVAKDIGRYTHTQQANKVNSEVLFIVYGCVVILLEKLYICFLHLFTFFLLHY